MTDDKSSFKQDSGMPLWVKLVLIAAMIAVGVPFAVIG